jgi:hypothetical protein
MKMKNLALLRAVLSFALMLALSHIFYLWSWPEAYNEQRLLPYAALIVWFFFKEKRSVSG